MTPQEELASAMIGVSGISSIQAGYTYLGQMISHDIVPPGSGGSRIVTSELELKSLYGSPRCQDIYFDGDKFRIGNADNPDDLHRSGDGQALIPERRNDENAIISQFHVFWQRLHNRLIADGFADSRNRARELVIRTFQLLVIEDFLFQILEQTVFEAHFRENRSFLHLTGEQLPPVFSLAAFRFGHSMVQGRYDLSAGRDARLGDLFLQGQSRSPQSNIN